MPTFVFGAMVDVTLRRQFIIDFRLAASEPSQTKKPGTDMQNPASLVIQ